jgi:hypothetical protein
MVWIIVAAVALVCGGIGSLVVYAILSSQSVDEEQTAYRQRISGQS